MSTAAKIDRDVAVVSCDIKGHSAAIIEEQRKRVNEINRIVADTLRECGHDAVLWLSGGDGGHVVFREPDWQKDALDLIDRLARWSRAEGVPLRITGHRGVVSEIVGADGRTQPVGSGINYAGWLTGITSEGVVVSDEFRRAVESVDVGWAVRFHDARPFPHRDLAPQLLHLMSLPDLASRWLRTTPGDYAALVTAEQGGNGWDVLYYVKRIWQVNSEDKKASAAMARVPDMLTSAANGDKGLLGYLRAHQLHEFLRLGQLVERKASELICGFDEPGDSLFLILHGEVGIYNVEGKGFVRGAVPSHVHRAGQIVGELGFALARNRTADLVALTDVALLAFNNNDMRKLLYGTNAGKLAAQQLEAFINERVVEHVAQNSSYLVGAHRTGPLSSTGSQVADPRERDEAWRQALRTLEPHCELIPIRKGAVSLDLAQLQKTASDPHGLYVLAGGMVHPSADASTVLDGAHCPVLWVDVPELISHEPQPYRVVEDGVKVLRIGADGINELNLPQRTALEDALRRVVGRKPDEYEYDVYLCHTKADAPLVREIHAKLVEADVRCWYDDSELVPGDLVTERIELGLRSSRYVLACASANFVQSAWAQREFGAVLHLDVKRRGKPRALVLMLNEHDDKDEAIPLLARDIMRLNYRRSGDFEKLVDLLRQPV